MNGSSRPAASLVDKSVVSQFDYGEGQGLRRVSDKNSFKTASLNVAAGCRVQ